MKKLGVIGGLGPMATAYFLQLITQMTDAKADQEHIEIMIHSKPSIPDRTKFILGECKENPLPDLMDIGEELVQQGAEILAMPCITAHFFQKDLEQLGVPVIHVIEATAQYLKERGVTCAGVMATDGTIASCLFQDTFTRYGIDCQVPDVDGQKQVMHLIYEDVKQGKDVEMDLFSMVKGQLSWKGAQVILLGCTELSMIKRDHDCGANVLDVMELLARETVQKCGKLKPEYEELITKENLINFVETNRQRNLR